MFKSATAKHEITSLIDFFLYEDKRCFKDLSEGQQRVATAALIQSMDDDYKLQWLTESPDLDYVTAFFHKAFTSGWNEDEKNFFEILKSMAFRYYSPIIDRLMKERRLAS